MVTLLRVNPSAHMTAKVEITEVGMASPAMKTLRALLAVAVLGVGLAGCGGGDARAEIEQAFKGYQTALLARDFPTACGYNAPESTQKLIASVATQGIQASTCEEALAGIYDEIDRLERAPIHSIEFHEYHDLGPRLLGVAAAMMALHALLAATWAFRLP